MIGRAAVRIEVKIYSGWATLTDGYFEPLVEVFSSDSPPSTVLDGVAIGIDNSPAFSIYFKNYAQTVDEGDFIAAYGGGAATALWDIWLPVEIEVILNDDFTITSTYRIQDDLTPGDDAHYTSGAPMDFSQNPTSPTDIDGFGIPILRGDDGLFAIRLAQYARDDLISSGGTPVFTCDYSSGTPFVPPFAGQYIDNVGDWKDQLGAGGGPLAITDFFPTHGSRDTVVELDGTGFDGVTRVTFNDFDAKSFYVPDTNIIYAVCPNEVAPLFAEEGSPFYAAAFAHNKDFAIPGPYQSGLSAPDEANFKLWVINQSIPFDVNATITDYDMRGYWYAQPGHGVNSPIYSGGHFPDTYKTPYDTSFSNESFYATGDCPFAWTGNVLYDTRDGSIVFAAPGDIPTVEIKVYVGVSSASKSGWVVDATVDPLAPVINSFNPTEGGPNTAVTIFGLNLDTLTAVKFDLNEDAYFVLQLATKCTAYAPGNVSEGPILVRNPNGFFISDSPFI